MLTRNFSKNYWGYEFFTTTYLINRIPIRVLKGVPKLSCKKPLGLFVLFRIINKLLGSWIHKHSNVFLLDT
jgi:hypothetical protein